MVIPLTRAEGDQLMLVTKDSAGRVRSALCSRYALSRLRDPEIESRADPEVAHTFGIDDAHQGSRVPTRAVCAIVFASAYKEGDEGPGKTSRITFAVTLSNSDGRGSRPSTMHPSKSRGNRSIIYQL
jgi:hypothetical protein